jgi:hypothetical protein
MNPIVLIELNEVPNIVLDAYARRSSFMALWLAASDRYTTVAADEIQLDPWVAWPSFHRGVNDATHKILHLGQAVDSADQYPPVWRMLHDSGVRTGVYGSLFSSAENDLERYAFFVPDVFSPHSKVKPTELANFQDFNLRMTRASGRNAGSEVSGGGRDAMLQLARSGRIRPTTAIRIARQLLDERLDRKRLSRRRNIQTELHADIFASLLAQERPAFSTFYTNNVAAAMHRFWSAAMPEGSINATRLASGWLDDYSGEVAASLSSVERLLKVLDSGRCGEVTVVMASAIGQEEIPASNHRNFLTIVDPRLFAERVMNVRAEHFELLPTMVPDFTIAFGSSDSADMALQNLRSTAIAGAAGLETATRMQSTIMVGASTHLPHIRHDYSDAHFKHDFTFCQSDDRTVHISLQMDDFDGEEKAVVGDAMFSFNEIGLGLVRHDEGVNCTAQHSAEGSLLVHRAGSASEYAGYRRISGLDFAPSVLTHFGVSLPSHLQGQPTIRF